VIRYLTEAEVDSLLPPPAEACELTRQTLVSLAQGLIDLPPKTSLVIAPGDFVNAMPAYSAPAAAVAVKIVGVYLSNRARELPTISGVVVSLDPVTGRVRGLLAAGGITAARTAAVTGACMARLAPAAPGPLGMTGAGVEGRTHLLVADALGWHDVVVYDHRPANIERLRAWAAEHVPALQLRAAGSPAAAAEGAACVVTGIPIGASGGEVPLEAIREDALVLPIDYSTSIWAGVANAAELLAADDPDQLRAISTLGHFQGWRELDGPTGRWLADDAPARPAGRVVVANLGVGAHDAVFANAILDRAEAEGVGVLLPE
jgi:ornithine cyclodeaminase/alanine dehydrogenase